MAGQVLDGSQVTIVCLQLAPIHTNAKHIT